MRLLIELADRYFSMEAGKIEDMPGEGVEITLPIGFQSPPTEDTDDEECETREVECR